MEHKDLVVIAVKADNGDWVLDVLGIPFGGPFKGKDRAGDFFSAKSNIHQDQFAEIPAVYAHGLDPVTGDGVVKPAYIGKASYSHVDSRGHWYKVVLNKASEYARKIWDAALKGMAGASTGAIAHLVRRSDNGHLDEWPAAEMTLVDGSGNLSPVNPYAIAVPALKTLYGEAGMKLDLPESEGGEPIQDGPKTDTTNVAEVKGTTMNDEEKKAAEAKAEADRKVAEEAARKAAPVDPTIAIMNGVIEAKKKENEEKVREVARQEEMKAKMAEMVDLAMKAAPAINGGGPALNLKTQPGDDENKAFWFWMRTGDKGAYKTSYYENEAVEDEGGAVVPVDFYNRIVEKRDIGSIVRQCGAEVYETTAKTVDVPVEQTREGAPVATAESQTSTQTSYSVNAVQTPLDMIPVTVIKYTRLHLMSEEALEDNKANLETFMGNRIGRAFGLLENTLFLSGTGTGATPMGAMYGSTKGKDAAAASAVSAADVLGLYYSLGQPYRDGAAWVMRGTTEAAIRGLAGNFFSFAPTPQGSVGGLGLDTLVGRQRVFNSDEIVALSTSTKSILFGNFNFYMIVQRRGITIKRLTERYADVGQIGFLASERVGGVITQAEAFMHLLNPSA